MDAVSLGREGGVEGLPWLAGLSAPVVTGRTLAFKLVLLSRSGGLGGLPLDPPAPLPSPPRQDVTGLPVVVQRSVVVDEELAVNPMCLGSSRGHGPCSSDDRFVKNNLDVFAK